MSGFETNVSSLMTEIDEVKKQKLEEITKLGKDIERAQGVLEDLEKQISEFDFKNSQLDSIEKNIQESQLILEKMKVDIDAKVGEHSKIKASLDYEILNLENLKEKKQTEVMNQHMVVDSDLESKKSQLSSFDSQIDQKQPRVQYLNSQVTLSETELVKIGTILNEKNKEVENLSLKLNILKGEIDKNKATAADLNTLEKDIESKNIELEQVTTDLAIAKEQLDITIKHIKKSEIDYSENIDAREAEYNKKVGELSIQQNSLDEKHKTLRSIKAELEKVHGKALNIII